MKSFALTLLIIFSVFIWQGGYWENFPILDRISGPMRFKQYVADPIPDFINKIRGGYSGFPQGRIKTSFSYSQIPDSWAFLKDWKIASAECIQEVRSWVPELASIEVFRNSMTRELGNCNDGLYLFLDQKTQRGVLIVG